MFGRQIFFEPMDSAHVQRRRDAFRHIAINQRHGVPCTELANIPSLRNDGLMLALNLILVEDDDRVQPNNIYLGTNCANTPNQHMLNYIRQMEERYIAMEKELTRTKMLIPRVTRGNNPVHHMVQTDANWKERALAKYGYLFGNSMGNQYRRNRPQTNISSRRKHNIKRGKAFSQNFQNDTYPIKEPCGYACQSRMVNGDSTTVCPLHNVSIILPRDTKQPPDSSEQNQTNYKGNNVDEKSVDKYDSDKGIFNNLPKHCDTFEAQKFATSITNDDEKTFVEVCQKFGKKDDPETSYHSSLDVKCEIRAKTQSDMSTPEFQPIIERNSVNNIFDRKSQALQPTCHHHEPNTNIDKKCLSKQTKVHEDSDMRKNVSQFPSQQSQCKRNYCNNNHAKNFGYERTRCSHDSSHSSRMVHEEKKDTYQRGPTPRSTVHTAYTPMPQCSPWNSALDLNVFTIQLLRLAVLLYAPALMPALNLLIARQTVQTSIPVPSSEGSNDLLSQIFTVLNNQQNVPNLRYAQNSGTDESPQSQRDSNWQNLSSHIHSSPQNITKQLRDAKTSFPQKVAVHRQFERNSIAVNTSLELCSCNNIKQSGTSITYDEIEDTEKLVDIWTDQKSELPKTMMQFQQEEDIIIGNKDENECSVIDADVDSWI